MENDRLYISSKLLENEVEISEAALQQEFYSILQKGGCRHLNTPLTVFLHEQELLLNEIEISQALENPYEIAAIFEKEHILCPSAYLAERGAGNRRNNDFSDP